MLSRRCENSRVVRGGLGEISGTSSARSSSSSPFSVLVVVIMVTVDGVESMRLIVTGGGRAGGDPVGAFLGSSRSHVQVQTCHVIYNSKQVVFDY